MQPIHPLNSNNEEKITLKGGFFVLSYWEDNDAIQLFNAINESGQSILKWLPWADDYDLTRARTSIHTFQKALSYGNHSFAIKSLDGHLLGCIDLRVDHQNPNRGTIGYWVRVSEQGKGIARKALMRIRDFAFTDIGLDEVQVFISPENEASLKVAEYAGFRISSHIKNYINIRGCYHDALLYNSKKTS
jgi:ribosomal-protein-serine acetyltransferase